MARFLKRQNYIYFFVNCTNMIKQLKSPNHIFIIGNNNTNSTVIQDMRTILKYTLVLLGCYFYIGLTSVVFAQNDSNKFVVVLDAGHGGGDPGNLGNGYKEKSIALGVTLAVGKELSKYPDIEIIYTRKTDVFLELYERSAIANKADADLFVSIHCNSHSSQASGTETFVLGATNSARNIAIAKKENEVIFLEDNYERNYGGFDPNSPESTIAIGIEQEIYVSQSIELARKIENNFTSKVNRKSRGLKQASLWVLHNTYMPSILVELGFLTNNQEGRFLNSKSGQTKMAEAIKTAILDYKNELDANIGDSFIENNNAVVSDTKTEIYEGYTFKVQLAASSRKLETKSYNFKGLSPISRLNTANLYKYYYGDTNDYNQAKKHRKEAQLKGYSTAFIVAFKDGNLVSLDDVFKSASN